MVAVVYGDVSFGLAKTKTFSGSRTLGLETFAANTYSLLFYFFDSIDRISKAAKSKKTRCRLLHCTHSFLWFFDEFPFQPPPKGRRFLRVIEKSAQPKSFSVSRRTRVHFTRSPLMGCAGQSLRLSLFPRMIFF